MNQVVLIKGGVAKENYKDFYDSLEQDEFDPYKETTKRWNRNLSEDLGEDYDIITIPVVNRHFADYKAWKICFEKVFPFLKDEIIFIGHSLGGTFLVKYFEEENNNKLLEKTKKIILVAPGFKDNKIGEILGSFNFDNQLINFSKVQNKITIFGSRDDFLVDFSDIEDYMKALPEAEYKIFDDRGHFLQEDFIELLEEIKK